MRSRTRNGRCRRAARQIAIALVAVLAAPIALLATTAEPAGAAPVTAVMGPSKLNAAQIARWFHASTSSPYRASVPVETLAQYYINEGNIAAVRGDLAFAQSIVETGWFKFPDGGYVRPTDNNFAGMGAWGDGSHLFRAPDAATGVRGQIQQLRRYADRNSTQYNIGSTPVPQLWNPPSNYDLKNTTHGWAPTWEAMSGTWASSTTYATVILGIYRSMLVYNGLSPNVSFSSDAFGAVDVVRPTTTGIVVAGWAINPLTTGPGTVHVYVDGAFAAQVTANVNRADIGASYRGYGNNHGFQARIASAAAMAPGAHTICVFALGGVNPPIGCQTVSLQPWGYLEQLSATPSGIQAVGWAVTPATPGAETVHLYVDGAFAGSTAAGGSRPGLGAWLDANGFSGYGDNHTFAMNLPAGMGAHRVCAYALGGVNPPIGCRTINVQPWGFLESATRTSAGIRVVGWAVHPQTFGAATVHFYVDGVFAGAVRARQVRPGLGNWLWHNGFVSYGDSHVFKTTIAGSPGAHTVCAYALGGVNPGIGCRSI